MEQKYKPLTLAIIIPVYNEERHIVQCLNSIAAQTVKPEQVIVVDNNCRDRTVELAKKFDFVTVISEPKQGRTHARNAGFGVATTDIVGRIDADSILHKDWAANVKKHFETDPTLGGLTGLGYSSPLPFVRHPKTSLWSRAYYWFAHAAFRTQTMWGATMAITKKTWLAAKNETCDDDNKVHEDQDLSLVMASQGAKIIEAHDAVIDIDGQTYRFFPKFWRYSKMYISTYNLHRKKGTFRSPAYPKMSLFQVLPGLLLIIPLGLVGIIVFSLLLFPIDWLMIKIIGAKEWLGNQDN